MVKLALAIVVGVICGLIVVVAGELGVGLIFAPPTGFDLSIPQQMTEYISGLPPIAAVIILVSWLLSAFVGGMVAGRLETNWKRASFFTGAVLLATNVPNMLNVPQPMWINAASFLMYFLLAIAGGWLVNQP